MIAIGDVRVLVVGDVMLDRYLIGDVDRISPEAPVPVVLIRGGARRDGGALAAARRIPDVELRASSHDTARIQEVHEFLLHELAEAIDEEA